MRLLFLFAATLLFIGACNDPGTIGVGLLGNEELEIGFTDTVLVKAKVVPDDSTFINSAISVHSIGQLDEPVFGKSTSQLFADVRIAAFTFPNFSVATLDSVVMRIALDSLTRYGDPTAVHHVEVFQLTEEFAVGREALGDELDSTSELEYGDLLGETMFVANYVDTVMVDKHAEEDSLLLPHLRVRLDDDFGEQFMGLVITDLDDNSFNELAKGLLIRDTPSKDNLLALNFGGPLGVGALDFYYTDTTTTRIYTARIGVDRFLNVNKEQEGSEVEAAFNNTSDDQEFLYLEPYSGANVEFDISRISQFDDKIINNVQLEITLAESPDYNYETYPAVPSVTLSYRDENDELVLISDISPDSGSIFEQQLSITQIEEVFGGVLSENSSGDMVYTMDISNHAIDLLNGNLPNNDFKIYMKSFFENEDPNRSIIHGNGVAGKGPKLKLVVTEP